MAGASPTERTINELSRIRDKYLGDLEAREAGALKVLIEQYAGIVKGLKAQLQIDWQKIEARKAEGLPPRRSWLYEEGRLQRLLDQAEFQFRGWSTLAAQITAALQGEAVTVAGAIVGEQLSFLLTPAGARSAVIGFDVLPADALNHLTGTLRDGSPLTRLFDEIGPQVRAQMADALVMGIIKGDNPRIVGRRMQRATAVGLARGVRIARTEMMRSYRTAHHENYRANSEVVAGWIWLSSRNGRTCAACLAMHGTFHKLDEELLDHPNGRCLVPGTVVEGAPPTAFVSRRYGGDIVSIRTASGKFLTVTPNHPILTDRGWIAAQFVVEGCNVVSGGGLHLPASFHRPHEYNMPTVIEEIPRAYGMNRLFAMPSTTEDFHGDGMNGDVYVVSVNGELRRAIQSEFGQPLDQPDFVGRGAGAQFLPRFCNPLPVQVGLLPPTTCGLSNGDASVMFREGRLLSKQTVGSNLVSQCCMCGQHAGIDDVARNPVSFGKRIARFTGHVSSDDFIIRQSTSRPIGGRRFLSGDSPAVFWTAEQPASLEFVRQTLFAQVKTGGSTLAALAGNIGFDRVVECGIRRFDGHVYNLETPVGWYLSEGIVTHNCTPLPVTKTFAQMGIGDVAQENGWQDMAVDPAQVESGESWFKDQPLAVKVDVLGPAGASAYEAGRVALADFVTVRKSRTWGNSINAATLTAALENAGRRN